MIKVVLIFEFANSNQALLFINLLDLFDVEAYRPDPLEDSVRVNIANSNKAGLEQIYDIAELLDSEIM
mgnify:FL=1|jgi:hypothetical protein